MNMIQRLKRALILRSLERRKHEHPFDAEAAERYALPSDADKTQINSYYFSCHDAKGMSLLLRFAQRGGGETEVWFAYRDAAGNACMNSGTRYGANAPAGVTCLHPGKAWSFFYDGEVRSMTSGAVQRAQFTGTFTASEAPFEFGYHMDSSVLAGAIAQQKWDKGFFEELQKNNQVHYEQQGRVQGELVLSGQNIRIDAPAMRDHSYGRRDWNYMNRHVWLMALLEDGSALNANFVSYPKLKLSSGYYTSASGTACVKEVSLGSLPSPGKAPQTLMYKVKLSDGTELSVACSKETEFVFPCGDAYTIHEGIGTFTTGGVFGRGIMEFGWNNDPSRIR